MAVPTHKLLIRDLKQVVQICSAKQPFLRGDEMDSIATIENGSVVVDLEGKIAGVGPSSEIAVRFSDAVFEQEIDGSGLVLMPGLVDAHTHPVWSGDRVHEFKMKLAGASYMDIHRAGGGIGFTVRNSRESSLDELKDLLEVRLNRMLSAGTTLVESKSGYGLDLDTEQKLLKALHDVNKTHPIDMVMTYLGAHSVPKGSTMEEATEDVIERQLPALLKQREEGELTFDFIDVFCEKGVFDRESSKKILLAGKEAGLLINFHGDELTPMHAGTLAAEVGALSVSHCEEVDEEGMEAMAANDVFAVLLPTTAYILKIKPPPARELIKRGVPVAIASDFNPNAFCFDMPTVMHLSSILMGMTLNEVLVASTINAAASINKQATHGSIEVGKMGDFLLVDAPCWEHLIYQFGSAPIKSVIKAGKVVSEAKDATKMW